MGSYRLFTDCGAGFCTVRASPKCNDSAVNVLAALEPPGLLSARFVIEIWRPARMGQLPISFQPLTCDREDCYLVPGQMGCRFCWVRLQVLSSYRSPGPGEIGMSSTGPGTHSRCYSKKLKIGKLPSLRVTDVDFASALHVLPTAICSVAHGPRRHFFVAMVRVLARRQRGFRPASR
jgi:hypothetical protein